MLDANHHVSLCTSHRDPVKSQMAPEKETDFPVLGKREPYRETSEEPFLTLAAQRLILHLLWN